MKPNVIPAKAGIQLTKFIKWIPAFAGMTVLLLFLPFEVYAAVDIEDVFAFGDIKSLGEGLTRLVPATFSVAIALVVIYFLIGSFRILSSGGDKEALAKGREMITHSIIGFVILMLLFLVFQFLLARLFGLTGFTIIQGL